MKKVFTILLTLLLAMSITACGDNGKKVESKKSVETEGQEEQTEEKADEGEIVDDADMRKEPIITDKSVDKEGESGPFKYKVSEMQVSKVLFKSQEMIDFMEVEEGKECTLVALKVEFENTTDDTNSIYPDQAVLTSNTKEQVNADMWLSDSIGGEFLGKVKKEGTVFFVLKDTNAEDLTKISVHIDAPHDDDYETIGDDIKWEFNFK